MVHVMPMVMLVAGLALLDASMHWTMPPAAWLGLVLILHGSRALPPTWLPGALWLAAFGVLWIGDRESVPASGWVYAGITAGVAMTVTLPFVLDRLCLTRLGTFSLRATLVLPLAFTAIEFARSRLTPAATFGSIAYTQYGIQPLMQLAAVTGIWGLTFVLAWAASTTETVWRAGLADAQARVAAVACLGVLGLAFVGGMLRLALAPDDGATLRIATLNRPADLFQPGEMTRIAEGRIVPAERAATDVTLARLHRAFLDGSLREARAGARVVVWPEQNLLVFADGEAAFLERARRLAIEEHVYLAMGLGTIHLGEPRPFENKLVLIDPAGETQISYRKTHPVVGWEAGIMRAGDGRLPVVATPDGRMAGAICFDADFPEFVRQAAAGEADVLLLPVNDWRAIQESHFQMHAFRAIEIGTPVVRAAAGTSGVFDAWGRVRGVMDSSAPGDHTLVVQAPIGRVPTVYAWTGDLLPWLCAAGLAALLVTARAQ